MENYKEKYEMALEKAKTLLSKRKRVSDKASMIYRAEDIESMFPEFQKPEDEEIRKELTNYIKKKFENSCSPTPSKNILANWINWLEKQDQKTIVSQYESKKPYDGDFIGTIKEALGQNDQNSNMFWHDISEEPEEHREIFCKWEGYADSIWHDVVFYHAADKTFWDGEHQIENVIKWTYVDEILNKSNPYSGVSFKYNNHTWGMCARDGGVEVSIDNELKAFVSIDKSFIYPISQSYLAPKSASQAIKEIVVDNANKVELKFHEGDFIKHNKSDIIYKVFSIDNDSYFLKNVETDEIAGKFERFNLEQNFHLWTIKDAKEGDVLWHSDSASNGIFIFKEIRHDGKVLCYCDYDSEDHFCLGEHHTCCWINDKYIKPATKEQRYLLFKKMKEAGYKWNVDEKELIKL